MRHAKLAVTRYVINMVLWEKLKPDADGDLLELFKQNYNEFFM